MRTTKRATERDLARKNAKIFEKIAQRVKKRVCGFEGGRFLLVNIEKLAEVTTMNVKQMQSVGRWILAWVGLAVLTPFGETAEPLRKPLADAVKDLVPWLKENKHLEVNLVEPKGPTPALPEAKPQDVRRIVTQLLAAEGIRVDATKNTKLVVDYTRLTLNKAGEPTALDIILMVTDPETGETLDRRVTKLTDRVVLRTIGGLLSSPFEVPFADVAKEVAKVLAKMGVGEVVLQSVHGPDGMHAGMHQLLRNALQSQSTPRGPIKVSVAADARLRATFRLAGNTVADLAFQFEFELVDGKGEPVYRQSLKVAVNRPEEDPIVTLAFAAPVTGPDSPALTNQERLQGYLNRVASGKKSPCHLEGNEVRSNSKSDFGVEIWVKGQPVKPTLVNGRAVVYLDEGTDYEVQLNSRHPEYMAAADLRIDGLTMFALRKTPGLNKVGLHKGGGRIQGWYESNEKHYKFRFGADDTSPAARQLPTRTETGTIVALFHRAWTKNQAPPADEIRFLAKGGNRAGVLGTTAGDAGNSRYTDVSIYTGEIRDTVVITLAPKSLATP